MPAQSTPERDDDRGTVTICAGPPECSLTDAAAERNAIDGCPKCKRITIRADGSEVEWQMQAN